MSTLEAITSLECSVVVPDDWKSNVKAVNHIIDLDKDKRRFPRIACEVEAAMQCKSGLPALRRTNTWVRILVRTVSRCGMGFWHGEAMFPLEQALIVLPNGIQRLFEVRRCRRIGASCFEIGGEFSELLDNPGQISDLR